MLKRLKQVFRKKKPVDHSTNLRIISAPEHTLSPESISHASSDIVNRLEAAGFSAYLVGGCVRDLLLKREPKDFDIATSAKPDAIRNLFRRSRIIGRRFQIVHVHNGREIIEVTTFRAHHETAAPNGQESYQHAKEVSRHSKDGMLLRDNVFGTIDEDARRRDFTANALYYHPGDNTIHDFTDGFADIQKRLLRVIGDPDVRYREDPVRMLRATRFAAKLGFSLDPSSAEPIPRLRHLLREIPSARLFDETLKLFMDGYGLATFQELQKHHLLEPLFPDTASLLAEGDVFTLAFIEQALRNTDERVRSGKRVTPAFLFAALLWPAVCAYKRTLETFRQPPIAALQSAAGEIVAQQLKRIAIPRRFTLPMREIWEMQLRLLNRSAHAAARLLANPKFRAGYDFVLLRERAGEDLDGLGAWWTRYQLADEEGRVALVDEVRSKQPAAPSGRRRSRRSATRAQ